ncbi:MAG: zf-TFIIB domain-containing protein [Deltaproteobacteria bacterium]|nr:zf-TFIIB domain-containing protein [Deltaproteobacteria bacterium]
MKRPASKGDGLMVCPRCVASVLEERHRDGVEVDVCPKCQGVWLDHGEMAKLLAAELAERRERELVRDRTRDWDPGRSRGDDRDSDRDRDRDRYRDRDRDPPSRRKGGFLDVLGDIFD